MRKALAYLLAIVLCSVTVAAETHRFVPKTFYNTFSFAHPPALRIKSGDRVITTTADAGGMTQTISPWRRRPNPQTGPFYIEGANRATCWSSRCSGSNRTARRHGRPRSWRRTR
jgi:hypothetical protein